MNMSGVTLRRAVRLYILVAAITTLTAANALAITRSEVMANAKVWTDAHVPYYEKVVSYRPYNQDCSGFVSYCWALGSDHSTISIGSGSFAHNISKDDLEPGDALLKDVDTGTYSPTDRHVVLFGGWTDDTKTYYWCYEEGGWVHPAYADVVKMPYPYIAPASFPSLPTYFRPIRYNNIEDDAQAQPCELPDGSFSDAFKDCYYTRNRLYINDWTPYNNGGGSYIHGWGSGLIQDLQAPDGDHGAIMQKNGFPAACWIMGAIWTYYANTLGGVSNTTVGWPVPQPMVDPSRSGWGDIPTVPSGVSGTSGQYIQCENGAIFWTSLYGAHQVTGGIYGKYTTEFGGPEWKLRLSDERTKRRRHLPEF